MKTWDNFIEDTIFLLEDIAKIDNDMVSEIKKLNKTLSEMVEGNNGYIRVSTEDLFNLLDECKKNIALLEMLRNKHACQMVQSAVFQINKEKEELKWING